MSSRFVFTKGIAMCKPAFVKEPEKNAKKLTMKIVLNDQNCHEILQISKNLHTQSQLQGEIFKMAKFCHKSPWSPQERDDFFYPNWQGTKLIKNYSQLLT